MQSEYFDRTVSDIKPLNAAAGASVARLVEELNNPDVEAVTIFREIKAPWPRWKVECRIVKERRDRPKRRRKRKAARLARRRNRG